MNGYLYIGLCLIIISTETLASQPLFLTPLLKQNKTFTAREASIVDQKLFLNISSHSGFLTIDERHGSHTFFWYFPVQNKPVQTTPWLIWLQGGPGATSLTGLFDEIGPFQYDRNAKKIIPREWTWVKDYSILFIDNPVGAGYSFTSSPDGFVQDIDTIGTHLYIALRQFMMMFPELRKAPLYIAGESYAGRYLPVFGSKISKQDNSIGTLDVNFQGLIMGNPLVNRNNLINYVAVYQQWGLIDSQGALAIRPLQDAYDKAIINKDTNLAYKLRDQLFDTLTNISAQNQIYNVLQDSFNDKVTGFTEFISRPDVRTAIHVGDLEFTFSNATVHEKLIPDFLIDISDTVMPLLERYKMLIYCGQLDMMTPCVQNAQARRRFWNWRFKEDFMKAPRTPWWYNNSIAGYVKSGGHFTEVLVRGAGHLAPMDKPEQMKTLISYFIRGENVPFPPNFFWSPEFTPDLDFTEETSSPANAGVAVSVFLNVLVLVMAVIAGVIYYLKWKRRKSALFYTSIDETSLSGHVLSLT